MGEDRKFVWPRLEAEVTQRLEAIRTGKVQPLTMDQVVLEQYATLEKIPDTGVVLRSYDQDQPLSHTAEWKAAYRTHTLSAIAELSEALEWTPWKPWRSKHAGGMSDDDVAECKLELVDTLCFLLNLWMLLGGDGNELAEAHRAKCLENQRRQKEGY